MVVSRSHRTLQNKKGRNIRVKQLAEFPPNSQVVWIHDREAILTVMGHDTKNGRVITSNGNSYTPNEVEVYKKEGT